MEINFKGIVFTCLILYLLLNIVSFQFANVALPTIIVVFVLGVLLKSYVTKKREQRCFSKVPKYLMGGENILKNNFCTVKYTPHEKIVVSDNKPIKGKLGKRSFTVSKENHNNVNKCWLEVCSVFDEYMYLDNLFSFIDKQTGSINIIYEQIEKTEVLPKDNPILNSMGNKNKKPAKQPLKIDNPKNIINFEDLNKKEENFGDIETYDSPVSDISNISIKSGDLIDVNLSNADKLSELPGINIVLAKKIIDYRNKNGFFKNSEEFLNIAGVKEHFRNQIKDLITTNSADFAPKTDDFEETNERTVD